MKSESIKELATALAKAQGHMQTAKKDSTNPHFKSSYADLASVWEACREALTSNGLSVVQITDDSTAPELVTVVTTLLHSSGEWIEGRLTMKPVQSTPQGIGSALTYCRRYALASMVGVAPEEDDGNAASQPSYTPAPSQPVSAPPQDGAPTPISLKRQIRAEMTKLKINAAQAAIKTGVSGIFELEDPEILSQVLEVLKAG